MRHVCVVKMNESELWMQCQKEQDDVKNALSKRCEINPAVIWLVAGRHPAYRLET